MIGGRGIGHAGTHLGSIWIYLDFGFKNFSLV